MCCSEIECLAYCKEYTTIHGFRYKSIVTMMIRSSQIIKERINAQVSMPNGVMIKVTHALYA